MERVVTDPQPNLNRAGVCHTQMQPDSWERYSKNVRRFAGFLVQFLGWAEHDLSLWAYTAMPYFFLFLSFLQVREVMPVELQKQVWTAIMVLGHLKKEEGADQDKLDKCLAHLRQLLTEVKGLQLRTRGMSTNPKVDVAPAGEVVAWQDRVVGGALEAAAS